MNILKQIINAFKEFRRINIFHRDLKLENILIHFPDEMFIYSSRDDKIKFLSTFSFADTKYVIKIADLGFAKQVQNYNSSVALSYCGSPLYMAPQILNKEQYNYKADIWSLGATYFEMLTGFPPFLANNKEQLSINYMLGTYKIDKDITISLNGLKFLNQCLQFDDEKRISFDEILEHPYITEQDPLAVKALHN